MMGKIKPVFYVLEILAILLFFSEIYVGFTYFQYVIFQNGYFSLIGYPITVAFVSVFTGLVMFYISWFIEYDRINEPFFKLKFGIYILILYILGIILNQQFGYLGRWIFGLLIILSVIYFLNRWYISIFQGRSIPSDDGIPSDDSRYIPSEVKRIVWTRDHGRCVICGSNRRIHYDHDIPFSKGGSNTVDNIRILCDKCNLRKSDKIE